MNKNILSKENIEQEIADLLKTKEIYKKETAKMRTRLSRLKKLLLVIELYEQNTAMEKLNEKTIQNEQ